jgi:NADH:ubiquinone oxidoreductase subunit 2 (subunit N)
MLALAGIPPTLGFLGKYLVFFHAIQHGHLVLALVGIAASLIGAVYYLRVVYVLYMKPEVAAPSGLLLDVWGRLAVLVAAAGTLVLGVCLTVSMLALAGIPPTLGFLGKYLVFAHAIQHGHLALALVGIAASLVGAVYYLRVVYVLYMKPQVQEPEGLLIDGWGRIAVFVAAAGTLVLGILPGALLDWLERAAGG